MARYQPSAVEVAFEDVHLSRVVLAVFVQLAPDRFLTVVLPHGRERRTTVTLTRPTHVGTDASGGDFFPGTARVIIQRKSPAIEGEFGWQAHGQPTEMEPDLDLAGAGQGHWTARVLVPDDPANEYRLVVEQAETLYEQVPGGELQWAERLVHTDIVEL